MESLRKVLRTAPALVMMGAMFLFAGVPQLRADDEHRECRARIEKAQHNLDRAVAKHGEGSKQADHARHDLNEQREHCWNTYKGYWGADNRWHDQRDWEERH